MNREPEPYGGLPPLLAALFDGRMTADEEMRLGDVPRDDPEAQQVYYDYCWTHALLRYELGGLGDLPTMAVTGRRTNDGMTGRDQAADAPVANRESMVPPPPLAPTFLSAALHGMADYFPEGMPLAYLIATAVTGLGILIASHVYMSRPEQVARQPASLPSPLSPVPAVVGRVTGMVDCKWERGAGDGGRKTGPENPTSYILHPTSLVALGDKFAFSSGLMEITYNTGAKVILQGSVTYKVESNGGYLAVGKLTGKLEKGERGRGERRGNGKSSIINHQSSII